MILSKALVLKLITYYSLMYGVDPKLSLAVAIHESGLKTNAIGSHGEIGLYQINPKYVQNPSTLYDVPNNIRYGIMMLSNLKKTCSHNKGMTFLVCYNVGEYGATKIRYPAEFPYVKKVRKIYETL